LPSIITIRPQEISKRLGYFNYLLNEECGGFIQFDFLLRKPAASSIFKSDQPVSICFRLPETDVITICIM